MKKLSILVVAILISSMFISCEKEPVASKTCHCTTETYADGEIIQVSEMEFDNGIQCSQMNSNSTSTFGSQKIQMIVRCK